jgi:hypothetical protein
MANSAQMSGDYVFSMNGQFSHCGRVTVFLVKQNNVWLIAHIAESQAKTC